uniref:Uncharacterized protein n=1 Tax=Leviviridae sp. TaxID=2027243 RepID=A0A514D9K5_9VIRU|nr:MAG: hypothetical protein H3RhizoL13590e2267_000003 [Leviviridae sp.]
MNLRSRFMRGRSDSFDDLGSVTESASLGCLLWFMGAGVVSLGGLILGSCMPDPVPISKSHPVISEINPSLLESCLVHRSPVPDCQRCR